jgi:hypothetical protein
MSELEKPGAPPGEPVVDLLWDHYRSLADETLQDTPAQADEKRSARGVMTLFVANCITRWVDRIEREPDAARRRELVDLLLGA